MTTPIAAREVHAFWFDTLGPQDWFRKSSSLDRKIANRFGPMIRVAPDGALEPWRVTPVGRLAEILVLDQFRRNMFRGQAAAFDGDPLALSLAKQAIEVGATNALSASERGFVYMPFMHSESLAEHERALELFAEPGLEKNLDHERLHLTVLERFGRYPQRNAALGRESTAEERAFLAQPGSGF